MVSLSVPVDVPGPAQASADGHVLLGVDFSSSPSRRKPVVAALGHCLHSQVRLDNCLFWTSLDAFGHWLAAPGRWVGVFDLPFGLPRELTTALGWPQDWPGLMDHYARLSRAEIRATFAAFCAARPVGGKFAHRACDGPAGSSPSMKWVNPPVAMMLHAGVPLLRAAGVHLPGLCPGDTQRVALEGYPGLLARELIGRRPYKSDERAQQTPARQQAREDLLAALSAGRSRLGLSLQLNAEQAAELVADASGDKLDAVLCLVQAAWASQQPEFGRPVDSDPLEGWIVSATWPPGLPAA